MAETERIAADVPEVDRAEVLTVSTNEVARAKQWRYWVDEVVDPHVPILVRPLPHVTSDDGFHANLTILRIGRQMLFKPEVGAMQITRAPDNRMREEFAGVHLVVALSGTMLVEGVQADKPVRRGDVYISNWLTPFHLVSATMTHHVAFRLPASEIDEAIERKSPHGRSFPQTGGLTALFRHHLLQLSTLSHGEAPRYAEQPDDLQALAEALLDGTPERIDRLRPRIERAQRAAIRTYIRENAPLGDLSSEKIATRFGMTVGSLERLFAMESSRVQDEVRDARLEACHAAFADPRLIGVSPAHIAASFGFGDWHAFCRAYQAKFGMAPGAVLYAERNFPR